VAFII